MPPPKSITEIMSQPRPAPAAGWSSGELHDRAQAAIAATRGQAPPPPVPFPYPGAAADDAKARANAALPRTPTSTPSRPPTPAELDQANLPDAASTLQAVIDKSHRMADAGASDKAEKSRREGKR
jgi:hypothetical protein